MKDKSLLIGISIYKTIVNVFRIILGIFIIVFGFNMRSIINLLLERDLSENYRGWMVSYLGLHLKEASHFYTIILALSLIILSLIELYFVYGTAKGKVWGIKGLIVTSILWVPVEFLFISKFLVTRKTIGFIINLIVLGLLIKTLRNYHGPFFIKKS